MRHLGLTRASGRFRDFTGTLQVHADGIRASGSVQVASIDTGDQRRDHFVRGAEFFDAEHHPQITFSCRSPSPVREEPFELEGDLRIRGVARPLRLQVDVEQSPQRGEGRAHLRLRAEGALRRSDYGLRFPTVGGYGDSLVGDTVKIELDLTAVLEHE